MSQMGIYSWKQDLAIQRISIPSVSHAPYSLLQVLNLIHAMADQQDLQRRPFLTGSIHQIDLISASR